MQAEPSLETVALSPRVQAILASVGEPSLRQQIERAARHCLVVLQSIGRLHLPQDHFELRGDDDNTEDDMHEELAPYVLGTLAAGNRLIGYVMETFPAPDEPDDGGGDFDFDLEFDLVDGPGGDGGGGISSKGADETKAMTKPEEVADAAHAFGGMLRSRLVQFGERLQMAVDAQDRWKLLGELDDFKHRITKATQAVLFGVLGPYAGDATRESILPEYRSAVSDSVALRTAVTELGYHIGRFNESLTDADIAVALMVGVSDRVARFSAQPIYRSLRAEDKKAVIDFRQELYKIRHNSSASGVNMTKLRYAVEGFSKFLESMGAISHREVLVLHDKKVLDDALSTLARAAEMVNDDPDIAQETLDEVVAHLRDVTGRNPELDAALREYREAIQAGTTLPVGEALQQWLPLVHMTLSMTG